MLIIYHPASHILTWIFWEIIKICWTISKTLKWNLKKRNTWQAQLSLSPFHSLSSDILNSLIHSFSSFFSLSKFFSTAVQQQITTCASLQVDLILAGLLGLTAFLIFKMNSTKCPSTVQRLPDCPATSNLPKLKTCNFCHKWMNWYWKDYLLRTFSIVMRYFFSMTIRTNYFLCSHSF